MHERQTEEQLRLTELMVALFWLANLIVRNLGRTERLCYVILLLQHWGDGYNSNTLLASVHK